MYQSVTTQDRFRIRQWLCVAALCSTLTVAGAASAQVCPAAGIVKAVPSPGIVDARAPVDPTDPSTLLGIGDSSEPISITIEIDDGDNADDAASLDCWELCETGAGVFADNAVMDVTKISESTDGVHKTVELEVVLDRAITPGEASVVVYKGIELPINGNDCSILSVAYRSHPANANGDELATVLDLSALINFINGVATPPWGVYSTDINHDGVTDGDDIARAVDLLNGTPPYDIWLASELPDAQACASDIDNDCIADVDDNCPETPNADQADGDSDGVGDLCDNCVDDANAGQEDSDQDNVGNACDNCPNVANQDQADSDSNGTGDACEPTGGIPADCPKPVGAGETDGDNDGVADDCDTAPGNANVCGDSDDDGCDDCSSGTFDPDADGTDTDGDGKCDTTDPIDTTDCPRAAETGQLDSDNDGVADFCDDAPNDGSACGDSDNDTCDDCSLGSFDPLDDGDDPDGNGICNVGDAGADGDGDGFPNQTDNCPDVSNADQADADGDVRGDVCDNCMSVINPDQANSDADDFGNACDNCPNITNQNQADGDEDGVGDACDNCPENANQNQADADADGVGDACESTPPPIDDADGDGAPDDEDNCLDDANPDQADGDGDGVGDVCDNCPEDANPDQADADADGIGDACEVNGDGNTPTGSASLCGNCGNGAPMAMVAGLFGWLGLRSNTRRAIRRRRRRV